MSKIKRRKYIKDKYFEISGYNPFYDSPISNPKLKLSPSSLTMVVDLIIDILEKEYDGEINWGKIT